MPIDYDTDVLSLYAGSVLTDAPYSGVPANLRGESAEQRILTTLEVVVSHMRLLEDRDEARLLHYVLSRAITGAGSGGFVYDDISSGVDGNVASPAFQATDDIRLQVVDPADGSDVLAATNVAAGGATLASLIGAINTASPGANDLAASDYKGRLRLVSANGYTIVVLAGGANDLATSTAGVELGEYKSKRTEVADRVRDEGVAFYETEQREDPLI